MAHFLFWVAMLTAVYALVLASWKPLDLLTGAVLAAVLLRIFPRFAERTTAAPSGRLLRHVAAFVPFAAAVVHDINKGTLQVARIVLGLEPLACPGIVAVPIGERTRTGVVVSGLATTLSPGSFLVDVDWEQGVILFHYLDASDPERLRADQREFYERYQRHVFP